MKFPLMVFEWAVMSVACMKKNSMMVLMKKFQLKKMMVKFLHFTDLSVYLHWPAIEAKCCVPVYHVLQLLSIPTVKSSRCPYTFLENGFKDAQKQFTENL